MENRLKIRDFAKLTGSSQVTEILGPDRIGSYVKTCPELYEQQRKLFGILDGFQWGEDIKRASGV